MPKVSLRRGLTLAAFVAATVLASCTTPEVEAPPPPPPPPPLAAVSLNSSVAEAASIYVAFVRDIGSIESGFQSADAIQAAVRKGAGYDVAQLSRGIIAYGAILALQSPEYVASVRAYGTTPELRQQMIGRIIADPAYAATLPGTDAAVGRITATIGGDITALTALADSVEGDAYKIQERNDPRRRWATQHVADRDGRLQNAKTLSVPQLPTAEDSARLFAAAHDGTGLSSVAATRAAPHSPAIINSLAIAALAALGAAGDEAKLNTDALSYESGNEFCFNISKLMLFQCLAASRPNYEDMFCAGRHIIRDLATCSAQYTGPLPVQTPIQTPVIQVATATDRAGK